MPAFTPFITVKNFFENTVLLRFPGIYILNTLHTSKLTAMQRPITIIIADDCDAFSAGLRHTLSSPGFQVVATAHNGHRLIELVKQYMPDIVLIDIRMEGMDGIAACRELHQLYPHIGKIALTMYDHHHPAAQEMLQAGASGLLYKDASLAEIRRCIETVYHGGTSYGSSFKNVVGAMMNGQANGHNLPPHLVELLQLIGEGHTSEEIALILHKSIDTIGAWRRDLLLKCGAKNVAGLIKFGVKHGIIKL
jgi:DNA-binding NarL/FixJ family response regulator